MLVNLAILAKHGLNKAADKLVNSKNMSALDETWTAWKQQTKDRLNKSIDDITDYVSDSIERMRNTRFGPEFATEGPAGVYFTKPKKPIPPNSQQQHFWSEMEAGKDDLAKKLDEGMGKPEKASLDNINDFVLGKKKFEEVLDDYAKLYVEVINIKNWSWKKNILGGTKLTATQRALIKQKAEELGLIPKITVTKVPGLKYGFADFEGAGVVIHVDELPESLWLKKDEPQFAWLDARLPDNVRELVENGTYTWHHTETPGKMQLVPFGIHNITLHNGGRTAGLWADAPR